MFINHPPLKETYREKINRSHPGKWKAFPRTKPEYHPDSRYLSACRTLYVGPTATSDGKLLVGKHHALTEKHLFGGYSFLPIAARELFSNLRVLPACCTHRRLCTVRACLVGMSVFFFRSTKDFSMLLMLSIRTCVLIFFPDSSHPQQRNISPELPRSLSYSPRGTKQTPRKTFLFQSPFPSNQKPSPARGPLICMPTKLS